MTKPKTGLALLVFAALAGAAFAQEHGETHMSATIGRRFAITLASNPSTGYGWQIDTAASTGLDRLTIDDRGTSAPPRDTPRVGAPVIHTWLVTPRQTGAARLELVYRRPFEHGGPAARTHTFRIDISR